MRIFEGFLFERAVLLFVCACYRSLSLACVKRCRELTTRRRFGENRNQSKILSPFFPFFFPPLFLFSNCLLVCGFPRSELAVPSMPLKLSLHKEGIRLPLLCGWVAFCLVLFDDSFAFFTPFAHKQAHGRHTCTCNRTVLRMSLLLPKKLLVVFGKKKNKTRAKSKRTFFIFYFFSYPPKVPFRLCPPFRGILLRTH